MFVNSLLDNSCDLSGLLSSQKCRNQPLTTVQRHVVGSSSGTTPAALYNWLNARGYVGMMLCASSVHNASSRYGVPQPFDRAEQFIRHAGFGQSAQC
jgi:hypothetical protein